MNKKEYLKFINTYFPKSNIKEDDIVLDIYSRVYENNLIIDILKKYIEFTHIEKNIEFLELYKIQISKILIYLPTNDDSVISYYLRSASESILKFLYSINSNKENISELKFRNLKEELFKKSYDNKKINNICIIYGENSNIIHDKEIRLFSELQYIEELMTKRKIDFKKIDNNIIKLLNNTYGLIIDIFKIKWEDFSLGDRKSICDKLSKGRVSKISEMLH